MPLSRRAASALALTAVLALAACTPNDNGNNTLAGQTGSPSAVGAPQTTGPARSPGNEQPASGGPVAIEEKDNEFVPKAVTVKAGDVTFQLKNTGAAPHTFTIKELKVDDVLNPGKSSEVKIPGLKAGAYRFICVYHESIGMVGELTVT